MMTTIAVQIAVTIMAMPLSKALFAILDHLSLHRPIA